MDRVRHAQSYPFEIPGHSFTYEAGAVRAFDAAAFERDGRVPVLAAGSNQSPAQLHRKFKDMKGAGAIHAQRAVLHDFDVVYAAHLSSYGSVPATFQASPGTAVTVFVLWLDEAQLARMHETEGNYTYDRLSGIRIRCEDGAVMTEAFAYSSKVGCLSVDGACVSLTEIAAAERTFRHVRQPAIQRHIRDRLARGVGIDAFILAHLDDPALRLARSAALGADAIPIGYRREIIATF